MIEYEYIKRCQKINSSNKYKTATAVLYGCPKCLFIVVIAGLGLSLGNQRINFNMNDLNMSEWPGTVETSKWSVPNLEDWRGQVQCYPYTPTSPKPAQQQRQQQLVQLLDRRLSAFERLAWSFLPGKGHSICSSKPQAEWFWHPETPRKMQMLVCWTGGSFGGNDAKCLKHSSDQLVALMGCFLDLGRTPRIYSEFSQVSVNSSRSMLPACGWATKHEMIQLLWLKGLFLQNFSCGISRVLVEKKALQGRQVQGPRHHCWYQPGTQSPHA